jgi:L-fuculose-phosphate aldolase
MRQGAGEPIGDYEVAAHAEALAAACRRLHAGGLLAGAEGNCSVRLPDGTVLVTASGVDKATIGPAHILHRHADGTECHNGVAESVTSDTLSGDSRLRPSSELQMHLTIYAARADVMAVVHAHPPVATGFATAGRSIPGDVLPEVPVVIGPAALVPYGRPGTTALSEALSPFLADHEVFLLANHGVTSVGRSLVDAMTRLESVEQAARILLVAELLGGARVLPGGEAAALGALWRRPATNAYSGQHSTDVLS